MNEISAEIWNGEIKLEIENDLQNSLIFLTKEEAQHLGSMLLNFVDELETPELSGVISY